MTRKEAAEALDTTMAVTGEATLNELFDPEDLR